MLYRRFGKTELQIPVISFGCMRSMHDWTDLPLSQIPTASTDRLEEIAHVALGLGIDHFETAHGYGSSERQLGVVLKQLDRERITLQTKVAPHNDPQVFIHNVHESLARLGQDHVELLAIHGINDYRTLWESCRKGGCLHAARQLQREGKIGHIGFSGHGPLDVILEAINHQEDGGFDYVNLHWYYIFDVNRPAIERARELDLGVYIISPTDKGGRLQDPPMLLKKLSAPLSPMLFNDAYCLSQPGVTSISVGASRPSDFDEHLKVLDLITAGRPEQIDQIISALETQMEAVTGFRRPEGIWDQLPDWEHSPLNMNMRFIHWLGNLAQGWDLKEFAAARYAMLGEGGTWVAGNRAKGASLAPISQVQKKYPSVTKKFINELVTLDRMFEELSAESQ